MKILEKNNISTLIMLLLLSINICLAETNQNIQASILLNGEFSETVSAKGFVFNENSSYEVDSSKTVKIDDKHIITFFDLNPEYLSNNTAITAFAKNRNGKLEFGNIQTFDYTGTTESFLSSVNKCEPPNVELNMQAQLSVMEKLIRIRSKLKENKKLQLQALLTPELLSRLEKTENSFGLKYSNSLNKTTNPIELVQRLYRVYHSLRNYRLSKAKKNS